MQEWVRDVVRRQGEKLLYKASAAMRESDSWDEFKGIRVSMANNWERRGKDLIRIATRGAATEIERAYHEMVNAPSGNVFQIL